MKIAARLQILGAVLLSVAGGIIHPAAGFTVAGGLALTFGIALERQALATRVDEPPVDELEPDGDGEG